MPRLAANLNFLFTERPFLDRFAAAAACGFTGAEILFPYDYPADAIAARLRANDLTAALLNLSPGDWDAGERGLAGLPGREAEFAETLTQGLSYARQLGCRRLHAMHGVPGPDDDPAACWEAFLANLSAACAAAAEDDVTILIEPLNPRDNPGYPLNRQEDARDVVAAVAAPNLKIQFDFYHCQIVQGDVATRLRNLFAHVGHIQIAGVPDRHEPDSGELNYPYLLELVDALGYAGWVACEYRPAATTEAGLGWAAPYGIRPPSA